LPKAATRRSNVRAKAVKKAPADASVARADVRLRAPLQPPPQVRDCLCFELHLTQAFASARKITAMQGLTRRRRSPRSNEAGRSPRQRFSTNSRSTTRRTASP
jgi:hypothetical protein